jgi:hypothetical protein
MGTLTSDASGDKPGEAGQLDRPGVVPQLRFGRSGALADLEEAIELPDVWNLPVIR